MFAAMIYGTQVIWILCRSYVDPMLAAMVLIRRSRSCVCRYDLRYVDHLDPMFAAMVCCERAVLLNSHSGDHRVCAMKSPSLREHALLSAQATACLGCAPTVSAAVIVFLKLAPHSRRKLYTSTRNKTGVFYVGKIKQKKIPLNPVELN